MDDPTLIGGAKASKSISKLGDVMCITGLALEFYLLEKEEKYFKIMKDASETAKLHYDEEYSVFMEHARFASGLDYNSPSGRLCNPGHSIEVSWFLLHLNQIIKDPEIERISNLALIGALELGWDKDSGGIIYMLDIQGKPLMDTTVTAENKLWWPMSEALYATILAYEYSKDSTYLEWCKRIWSYIEDHFLDKENGGEWFGYLRKDGTVFNRLKGGNYKGCFHVPRALLFSIKASKRILNN